MTTAARIPSQQFQVSRLTALPAVLLRQLETAVPSGTAPVELLLQNPALLIRVVHGLASAPRASTALALPARLRSLDTAWLHGQIAHSALQQVLQQDNLDHLFLARHWQLSRRISATAAALARETGYPDPDMAAITGLLLRAGMLVLDQQGPAYAVLTDSAWQQPALLRLETEALGLTHIDAGVRLLESWHLDPFCVDALRYQALPLAEVLDAAPLVRICRVANALASAGLYADPDLLAQVRDVLNVPTETLQSLLAEVDATFTADTLALDLPVLPEAELPHSMIREVLAGSQQQLLQLRHEVGTSVQLSRYTAQTTDTPATLRDLLVDVLEDAGIEARFIVLAAPEGSNELRVATSAGIAADLAGLSVVCTEGRSALASAILSGDVTLLTADTGGLAIIDRQLLGLLNPQGFICEAVQHPQGRSVLLLTADSSWLRRFTLRRFIRGKLESASADTRNPQSAGLLIYRQQVREAVHEANNPLTIIKNYLQILELRQHESQAAAEIRLIRSEIDRVAAILAGMTDPAGASAVSEIVDLNSLVASMQGLFAGAFAGLPHNVQFHVDLASQPALILGNPNALKQVLTNLVKNAMEAIDGDGSVTLFTKVNIWQLDQAYVQLTVADTGPGIAQGLMTRLFKQPVSTREGSHRGSGLMIVKQLVDAMQGWISYASDSKGTALTLWFPQVQQTHRDKA